MKQHFCLLIVATTAVSFFLASSAFAHQPRLVKEDQLVIINNPEVSQAFYGELKDRGADYLIYLKQGQNLFFQILVPDLPEIEKDKTVNIQYAEELGVKAESFIKLDPATTTWKEFYEEYAGDNYLEGPKETKFGEAGYYFIKVSSPDNIGKYVLVVGEKEEFPAAEIAKAAIAIPRLKTQFFNKPWHSVFEGKAGKYFAFGLAGLLIFGFLFHRFRKMFR